MFGVFSQPALGSLRTYIPSLGVEAKSWRSRSSKTWSANQVGKEGSHVSLHSALAFIAVMDVHFTEGACSATCGTSDTVKGRACSLESCLLPLTSLF